MSAGEGGGQQCSIINFSVRCGDENKMTKF